MNNITTDFEMNFSLLRRVNISPKQFSRYIVYKGDILINNTNSPNLIGKAAVLDVEGNFAFSNHLARIRLRDGYNPIWVLYYLRYLWQQGYFEHHCQRWVNQAAFHIDRIKQITILIPPSTIQNLFDHIIQKYKQIRKKRKDTITATDKILESIFIKMFGDPMVSTKRWERLEFRNLIDDIRYGTSVKCAPVLYEDSLPILRIPNVVSGSMDFSDLKFAKLSDAEMQRYCLKDNDLLFVRTNGRREYVGRNAVFHGIEKTYAFASYLIRVRPKKDKLNSDFTSLQFSLPSLRTQLFHNARTSAGQYNININGIGSIKIIVPPLVLQEKFANIVERFNSLRDKQIESERQIQQLNDSLTHNLFEGKTGQFRT